MPPAATSTLWGTISNVRYLHRLAQLCGLELVVFGTHCFGAINAFQPAHREMAARQAVVLLDKGKVDRGPADGADNWPLPGT